MIGLHKKHLTLLVTRLTHEQVENLKNLAIYRPCENGGSVARALASEIVELRKERDYWAGQVEALRTKVETFEKESIR